MVLFAPKQKWCYDKHKKTGRLEKTMDRKQQPIGVFDSGVGGISVLRELLKTMPHEDYIYLGDSVNAPYGTKKLEEVRVLTIRNVDYLLKKGVKSIVVACNTATSAAVAVLREMYPQLPLVGIEPAIKPATVQNPGGRIIVMATPMTLSQEKFQRLMKRYERDAQIVPLPCPGLMEFVEEGNLDGGDLKTYLQNLFEPVKDQPIDGVVLGCTHYPFARRMIQQVLGDAVTIYDGGEGTAREMRRRLQEADLLCDRTEAGQVTFCNSRNTPEEQALCERLLNL